MISEAPGPGLRAPGPGPGNSFLLRILQAMDSLKTVKSIFTPFLASDVFCDQLSKLEEESQKAINRANTSCFEAWIMKIVHGAEKTKARNPSKAITSKHTKYTMQEKCDPASMVHPVLWKAALPMIGEQGEKDKGKKEKKSK